MHRTRLFFALSALVAKSMAHSADFVNTTFGNATVGQLWPIHWTTGNGGAVSLSIGNGSYSSSIFASLPANPGSYNWTVTVSPTFSAGYYSLALSQAGAGTATSATFHVSFGDSVPPPPNSASTTPSGPTVTSTTTVTTPAISSPPTVTVIWIDDDCGCTKTSTCNTIVLPTANNGSYIPKTVYDEECGCTQTAYPVAPTMVPVNNYTVSAAAPVAPATTAPPAAPAAPTMSFPGAGAKVSSPFGLIGLVAAVLAL